MSLSGAGAVNDAARAAARADRKMQLRVEARKMRQSERHKALLHSGLEGVSAGSMFCPACRTEYAFGNQCPDCGEALVEESFLTDGGRLSLGDDRSGNLSVPNHAGRLTLPNASSTNIAASSATEALLALDERRTLWPALGAGYRLTKGALRLTVFSALCVTSAVMMLGAISNPGFWEFIPALGLAVAVGLGLLALSD